MELRLVSRSSDLVGYGPLLIPASFEAIADAGSCEAVLRVETDEHGPRCVSLTLAGERITSSELRATPIAHLVRIAVQLAAVVPNAQGGAAGFADADELQRAEHASRSGQRRWRVTDEHLAAVANVYRAEENTRRLSGQRGPTTAVAEHFETSRPTAGRWVMAARRNGLLPAVRPGSSG